MPSPTIHGLGLAGILIASSAQAADADHWAIPIAVKTLDNGLTVVVSEDHSSPTVGISVVYRVGFRREPRNRSGFAHLFEHLMFEGTPNAPVGVFDRVITSGGGDNNGSTHPDFTNYVEQAPVSALEPILWLEADRMKTLDFNPKTLRNQQDVVKEEIRVNVKNQPYGGFAWTDLPMLAFAKWENSHDGYGSFEDLEHAKLDDVRAFHRDFYGPNNAVLGIAGDVTPAQAFALAEKYFGAISRRETPPRPDVSEPLNVAEKRKTQGDALARLPALAVGWKMPARGTPDHAPMVVLGELLAGGEASRLYQSLVKGSQQALQLESFTGAGSPWEFDGPALFTVLAIYKQTATADQLLAAIDVEIAKVAKDGVDDATLQSIKTRMLAQWYDGLDAFLDRADTLANLQALWGDAKIANQVPSWIAAVSSADLQRVAGTYLTKANRTAIDRRPDVPVEPEPKEKSVKTGTAKPRVAKPAADKPPANKPTIEPPPAKPEAKKPVIELVPAKPEVKETVIEHAPAKPEAKKPVIEPASAKPEVKEPVIEHAPAKPEAQKPAPEAKKPVIESATAKPEAKKPVIESAPAKPEAQKSAMTQPVPTTVVPNTPAAKKPATSEPASTKPEAKKPAKTEPASAKPATKKPVTTEPASEKSEATKPVPPESPTTSEEKTNKGGP